MGYIDIGENSLIPQTAKLKYGANGTATELPFATLDHRAMRFGPETLSIHSVNDGLYHFVVSNAAQSFTTPEDFHTSTARSPSIVLLGLHRTCGVCTLSRVSMAFAR